MPRHDPVPQSSLELEQADELLTRSMRREKIIAKWREQMLSQKTKSFIWFALFASFLLMMAGTFLLPSLLATAGAALLITALASYLFLRLRKHDAHIQVLSTMTPIVDWSVLTGEVAILEASRNALIATLSNSASTVQTRIATANGLLRAAQPIMARGGITEETATVSGYPPYPEIDQTELPGSNGDFLSIHLMRIDASVTRVARSITDGVVLAETIGQLAGEVVPPLRALEAALQKKL